MTGLYVLLAVNLLCVCIVGVFAAAWYASEWAEDITGSNECGVAAYMFTLINGLALVTMGILALLGSVLGG